MKEHDIQTQILEFLKLKGIVAWRSNTGASVFRNKGKNYFVRFGIPGQADITGILPDGRRLEIEVKTPEELEKIRSGKIPPSKRQHIAEQKLFLKIINENNGVAFFASSVEQLINKLKAYGVIEGYKTSGPW